MDDTAQTPDADPLRPPASDGTADTSAPRATAGNHPPFHAALAHAEEMAHRTARRFAELGPAP
ncbi:Uncharacterised protein [uncultured archaeon]|nr:Uncharacterised protein [uncultured archaeon]